MPCIAGNYSPAVGVLLQVAILPPQLTAIRTQQQPSSPQNLIMFAGLVDTGASVTCISKNVVQTVGLQLGSPARRERTIGFGAASVASPSVRDQGPRSIYFVEVRDASRQALPLDPLPQMGRPRWRRSLA